MDLPRFAALCDAYGGAIARWPVAERAAASEVAATVEGARLLARADRLDEVLAGWRVAPPPVALAEALVGAAPRPRGRSPIAWWWSGLAGLTVAGAAAGALAVAALPPLPTGGDDGGGYADTAFGDWESPR